MVKPKASTAKKGPRGRPLVITDRSRLLSVLKAHRWVLSHAAKALGISRQTLYASMERCDISRKPMDPAYLSERNSRAAQAPRPNRRTAA